jgi:branched-chain amino acid transport system substrate-binding protein
MKKKLIAFLSILSLSLSVLLISANAAVKPGTTCKILGSKVVAGSFAYTCVKKNSKKYVWDKGAAVKKSSKDFQEQTGSIELGVGNVRLEAAGCHEKGSATLQIQSSEGWKDLFPASGWIEDSLCMAPQIYKPYFEGTLVGGSIVRWRTLNSSKLEWLSSPQSVTFGSNKTPKLLIVATDLPLQGGARDLSNSTNKAVELVLKQMASQNLIGNFVIGLKFYDNSTVSRGSWDGAACAKNAQAHASRQDEVAVLGAYNAGCTKIMVPILNKSPNGPMSIISHSASNPGLTKFWSIGEPEKYYPNKQRNFFRIATTDDSQGYASAKFALDLGVKSVFVLNDGTQPYGPGIARSFISAARELGLNVLSEGEAGQQFNPKSTNHSDLFTTIKSKNPDLVYVGGIFDGNQQLIKDKVKYLGDNTKVKLMLPDGFTGYPDFLALPEAQGAYISFAGLNNFDFFTAGGAAEKFQNDYRTEYGQPPVGSYPVYGAAVAQVLLTAIAKSDGSREDVLKKLKEIVIPAEKSVTGFEVKFDQNGDSVVQGVTLLQVQNKREVFIKSILR